MELMNCNKCGSAATIYEITGMGRVGCEKCHDYVGYSGKLRVSKKEAIKRWNKKASMKLCNERVTFYIFLTRENKTIYDIEKTIYMMGSETLILKQEDFMSFEFAFPNNIKKEELKRLSDYLRKHKEFVLINAQIHLGSAFDPNILEIEIQGVEE